MMGLWESKGKKSGGVTLLFDRHESRNGIWTISYNNKRFPPIKTEAMKSPKQMNSTIKQLKSRPVLPIANNKLEITKKVKNSLSPNSSLFSKSHQ